MAEIIHTVKITPAPPTPDGPPFLIPVRNVTSVEILNSDTAPPEGVQGAACTVIEDRFVDGAVLMLEQNLFGVCSLFLGHVLHGFKNGTGIGGQAHFRSYGVEIEEWPRDCSVQIEDNRRYSHHFLSSPF